MSADFVGRFRAARDGAGLFCDFDGTLSEIVHLPNDARPLAGVRDVLTDLAAKFGIVAVVSGRSAGQLLQWLGPDIEIWGVHGAEEVRDGSVEVAERARPFVELMRDVHSQATERAERLGIPGVVVEDKRVMIGLHFRAATDREAAEVGLERIAADLANEYGLIRAGGKLAFELRPPIEFSKKEVVLERAHQLSLDAAAFVGDDIVDLPGFDAVDELEAGGALGLRVAVASTEAPAELLARADVVVDGPTGVLTFLQDLARPASG